VLHVIASLRIGGTERQLVEFINRSSAPASHFIALFDEEGPLARAVPNRPILFKGVSRDLRRPWTNLAGVRELRRLIRTLDVDIIHAHLGISEVLASAARPKDIPLIAARRGKNIGFEERWWLRPVEAFGHVRADVMICNSEYLAEHTRKCDWLPPPIVVIHNGVDLDAFYRAPWPTDECPTITVVANFHEYKRHDLFIRAFQQVANTVPGARALLVGDGRERPLLEVLVRESGLVDRVEFVGQATDPRPYLQAAHVVALTSDHEGFPNAVLEGMAMGRPIVATPAGGIRELVRPGEDGFIGASASDLATAMVLLLRDAQLREAMGHSARLRAEGFGWPIVVSKTEGLYRTVLGTRRRRW
jgi:glycosyltransferase involved in cell wall biosynthesis